MPFHIPRIPSSIVVAAKLIASLALLLATLGLLWHKTFLRNWIDPGEKLPPDWIVNLASGWYPEMIWTGSHMFLKSAMTSLVYFLACLLCVGSFFLIPFIANTAVRVFVSLIFMAGLFYDLTMYDIGGFLPSLPTTSNLIANARFGLEGGTVGLYRATIFFNLFFTVPILIVFFLRPPRPNSRLRAIPFLLVAITTASILAIVWRTDGFTSAFPSPVTSYINVFKAFSSTADQKISEVNYASQPHSSFQKIILIMDESVRGDYLSINNPSLDTTPFLSRETDQIINFGNAVSSANCSTPSRLAIRFGIRDKDIGQPWKGLKSRATIWQYAKKAGFEDIYIDTFGTPVTPSSEMTSTEKAFLDSRIVVIDLPRYKRDEIVADRLRELMHSPGRMFIFVDKHGTHVPYDGVYPPAENYYGADSKVPFTVKNRDEEIKHYKNAIRWSVDHFFSVLLSKGIPPDTLILYTSDHGQSLSETASGVSHCSEAQTAVKSEAIVPLFAITSVLGWRKALSDGASVNFGRASHFDIVPTLLAAMGYDKGWIANNFDNGLLDQIPAARQRRFMAGEQGVWFDK